MIKYKINSLVFCAIYIESFISNRNNKNIIGKIGFLLFFLKTKYRKIENNWHHIIGEVLEKTKFSELKEAISNIHKKYVIKKRIITVSLVKVILSIMKLFSILVLSPLIKKNCDKRSFNGFFLLNQWDILL